MIYLVQKNGEPYYIGKSARSLKIRLSELIYRYKWKRSEMEISGIDDDDSMEEYWIQQFQSWGFNISNFTFKIGKQGIYHKTGVNRAAVLWDTQREAMLRGVQNRRVLTDAKIEEIRESGLPVSHWVKVLGINKTVIYRNLKRR